MRPIALLHLFVVACLAAGANAAVGQPAYRLSSKPITSEFVTADWKGRVTFPNVYCVDMPMSTRAKSLRQAFFNSNAIYLIDVSYPENLFAAIAVSTIPATQNAESAIQTNFVSPADAKRLRIRSSKTM